MNRVYILIVIILFLSVSLYMYSNTHKLTKSEIDGKYYKTKNNHLAQQSANILSRININILKLISYIRSKNVQPEYASRLYSFNPHSLEENILDIDTSYTLNKGSYVVFCLSPRESYSNKTYDINTLMYVAIHELAHIVTISIGHTPEFTKNFKSLLKYAVEANIYKLVDYSKNPEEYCGISINKNILK